MRKAGTRQSERRLHACVRACLGVCVCVQVVSASRVSHTAHRIIDEGQGEAVCESSTVAAVLCVSDTVPVAPPHGSSQCVLVASDSKRCAVFFSFPRFTHSLVQLPASKQSLPGLWVGIKVFASPSIPTGGLHPCLCSLLFSRAAAQYTATKV